MGGKWLEVLKETAPRLARVMTILHPETPVHQEFWQSIQTAASHLAVEARRGGVHDAAEIERTISAFAAHENSGLIVLPHAVTVVNRDLIIDMTLRYQLPAIYADSVHSVTAGALVFYGIDLEDLFGHVAEYVNRILHGEMPSDLPVQGPTKFKLLYNLKTAKAIGLDIPPIMLARADEVIE
jgi:putative tryptophan/tyrosine transport system substrate-binding protein